MSLLKEYWEILTALAVGGFGFGELRSTQKAQGEKITKLEKIIEEDIPEMKDMLSRIDERTKKL